VNRGVSAPRAWVDAIDRVEAEFVGVADSYLRARAADVHAVGHQVVRVLVGAAEYRIDGEGVLVADDLTPAQVADLDPARVRGIVLASGSPTGHSAILARSRAIPAVVAAGAAVLDVPAGTTIALDGGTGELFIAPTEADLADLHERHRLARAKAETALAAAVGSPYARSTSGATSPCRTRRSRSRRIPSSAYAGSGSRSPSTTCCATSSPRSCGPPTGHR
jgi:phosphoenolpyruvate-protein kinase (PTS system EI component)